MKLLSNVVYCIEQFGFVLYRTKDQIKWFFKKRYQLIKYGYSLDTVWGLSDYIISYALPRLKHLQQHGTGHPPEFKSEKEWKKALSEIIIGFELYQTTNFLTLNQTKINKMNKAATLFGKHLYDFWD